MLGRGWQKQRRISTIEDDFSSFPGWVVSPEKQISFWFQKADNLENRLRRINLRIVGLPEKAEGQNPGDFVEAWLKSTFPEANFSAVFAVERACRVSAKPPIPGSPLRPLLARMLNCKDRDLVLCKARQKGKILFKNVQILIFTDFSVELQKQRATFTDVK